MAAIFPALYSIIWLYNRIFLNIAYTILQLICTPRVSRIPSINSSVSWAVLDLVGGFSPWILVSVQPLPASLNFFEFEIPWFQLQQLLLTISSGYIFIYLYIWYYPFSYATRICLKIYPEYLRFIIIFPTQLPFWCMSHRCQSFRYTEASYHIVG